MELLGIIGNIAGVVACILFVFFRKGAQKYVDEKAKNLATIEDTEKITKEVEKVKAEYLQRSHAWKQIFEKEYSLLREVWNATWEFQSTARSLRPLFDRLPEDKEKQKIVFTERYERHINAANSFIDFIYKNRPFIPPHVYETCLSLRRLVIELQVDFEMSFKDNNDNDQTNWDRINECSKKIDIELDELNNVIRNHIYGKMNGAEQDA